MNIGKNGKKFIILTVSIVLILSGIAYVYTVRSDKIEKKNEISSITNRQKIIGGYVDDSKYLSHKDVIENIAYTTMPVFGSSEFNHGNDTEYHPTNLFAHTNVDLMIYGTSYCQSLNLAIGLGAIEPQLKKRKAVILLSPSWFYAKGVTEKEYSARFSDTFYMAAMENPNISVKIKNYISRRSEELLNSYHKKLDRVKLYNQVTLGNPSEKEKERYKKLKKKLEKKASIKFNRSLSADFFSELSDETTNEELKQDYNWDKLAKKAREKSIGTRNNPYFIDDERYAYIYKDRSIRNKGTMTKSTFEGSPEYDDLKCFLDICKETGIEPLLILEPMNGFWYDDMGFPKEKRVVLNNNIKKIAAEYKVQLIEYPEMEYEMYFLLDPYHLDGEGWVFIDKAIANFYSDKPNI